ncbi:olfactory receptor 1009-like [Parambassis ranga]|uniref:Olfactory receptor 1009-like n=1 Tax=Parambassis ranga TaxID=210632 RepID=A0A6P7JM01_9TELE|nr:olfactory receptor 1009-like [Parambassis ranga]
MFQVDENYTRVSQFVIVGFPGLQLEYFILVAWFFFLLYVTTVVGNLLLVVVFALEHSLQKPMYIIVFSLALSDIVCGLNQIIHAFCNTMSLTPLVCGDPSRQFSATYAGAMFILYVLLAFIIFCYICIIISVLRMTSRQGRTKTFSTCATLGCIISIYYIPRFSVYSTPFFPNLTMTPDMRIATTLFYSLPENQGNQGHIQMEGPETKGHRAYEARPYCRCHKVTLMGCPCLGIII